MPLATIHLLALSANTSIPTYLAALRSDNITPLVISKPIRWIIKPENLSTHELLDTTWDLLIVALNSTPFPAAYLSPGGDWVSAHWSVMAGVPSSLVKDFAARNAKLLRPGPGDVPALTGAMDRPRMAGSTQGLELNGELLEWSKTFALGQEGAVSMLNLLKFHPTQAAHESYLRYGKAFAESIGSRRGGNAKIVGKVVRNQGTDGMDGAGWDEIALAHYPSINHFTDMLASEDYQKVNHEHRLPALMDTCILCTSELDPRLGGERARL